MMSEGSGKAAVAALGADLATGPGRSPRDDEPGRALP
jgi:hypothetical protein